MAVTLPGQQITRMQANLLVTLAPLVCAGAILFNTVLALINANVMPLSRGFVVLAEIGLTAMAVLLILKSWRPTMLPWIVLILFLMILFFFGIVINQEINLKYIRDALIFPIYVLLGMTWAGRPILPLLVAIQAIIFAVFLFEALIPSGYAQVFNVSSYYINTRDYTPEDWTYHVEGFFISAFRPDARFIPGFDWLHRTSSVFLEPVSLGNYVTLTTILILTFWHAMGARTRAFMVFSTALLLIGSDSRLGSVTGLIIIAATPLFVRAPRYLHVFYVPIVIIVAILAVESQGFRPGEDDFPGRIAAGLHVLANMDFMELMGETSNIDRYVDSGIAYFVASQGVLGLTAILVMIGFGFGERSGPDRIFIHGITTYFALSLLVSYSAFSIKTAALMWFVYGYLLASRESPKITVRSAIDAKPAPRSL